MRGLLDHPLLILVGGTLLVALLTRGRSPGTQVPTGHRRTVCPRCDRITMSRGRFPLEPPRERLCRACRTTRDEKPRPVMRRETCPRCGRGMWSHRHYPPDQVTTEEPLPVSPYLCGQCTQRRRRPPNGSMLPSGEERVRRPVRYRGRAG